MEVENKLISTGADFHHNLQVENQRQNACRQLFTRTSQVLSSLNTLEKYQILQNVPHYKQELVDRSRTLQNNDVKVLIAGWYIFSK